MEHLNQKLESSGKLPVPGKQKYAEYTLARNQYVHVPPSQSRRGDDEEEETSALIEYWRILRRHKGTWIIFAFVTALLGFLITLPQTSVYQARTSIEIVGFNENFLNFKQTNPVAENGSNSEISDIQTQIKVLQSESLLDRVFAKFKSGSPEATPSGRISAWGRALNLPQSASDSTTEQTLKNIAKSLKVRAAGQTRIVEITVDSTNPQLAAQFANTLANEFIEQNLESRWKTTERTSSWLARQLDDMKIKLEHSEDALQTYARNSKLIFTQEKTNVSEDKLRQLQQELSTAQAERIGKQSRYEIAKSSPPDALPDVLNDAGLRETQSKITELRRQIAELSTTFTPEHAKVKRVQAQMVTLQSAFQHDRSAILNRIRNEYEEVNRKEKLLAAAYDAQTGVVTGQGEKAIQYNILKREADSNRQLYDAMLQQLKESTIASAMRASNIRIVDEAKVPLHPYKPNAPQSAGLGLLVGTFLGAAFIIMRERADRTIQQPGELSLYLNVPELGIIPSEIAHKSRLFGAHIPAEQSLDTLSDRVELVTWKRKPSMVAESFRSTLISILFAAEKGGRPKVLVLTSPSPGEGKSTVASNLAIAIAEVGQKVLLIDADMRKPRQHEIFAMKNERGLSSILREKTSLNGNDPLGLGGLIRESEIPGLFLLTSGPSTSAATTLLYSSHMPELLEYLRDGFETVLIDTPPMLQMPDARVLGRLADKVIIVIRAGKTTREAALAATHRLSEDGVKVLGTILNDWNPKSAPSGYYSNYDKYYSRYSDSEHSD
jgi:polysaccharide biosynthesis transport protein